MRSRRFISVLQRVLIVGALRAFQVRDHVLALICIRGDLDLVLANPDCLRSGCMDRSGILFVLGLGGSKVEAWVIVHNHVAIKQVHHRPGP